ncbi:MAG: hypothetical protein QW514_01590 [Thermoprotei archaeon]
MSYSAKWWVEKESVDRNLVVVGVNLPPPLELNGELTQNTRAVVEEVKSELGVEEYFAGVYNPETPHKLYFQYPTQKIVRVGDVVRVNIPARLLKTTKDYVTIKKNPDGTVLIIP